jgi:hypothetical protein
VDVPGKEGILQMQPPGRWAVCRPGLKPIEINSGDNFLIEVDGLPDLKLTRMEFWRFSGPLKGCEYRDGLGEITRSTATTFGMVFALLSASDPGIKPNLIESDEARRLLGLGVRLVLSTPAGALSCGAGCPIIIWQISGNWWQSRACDRAQIETLLASVVPKPGEGPQRKHYITNIIVMLGGQDRASARSDYLVIRESPAGHPGDERDLLRHVRQARGRVAVCTKGTRAQHRRRHGVETPAQFRIAPAGGTQCS